MWPFKSVKSLKASGIFEGFTDWHSHILPGVDDGIKTLDDSLKVLEAYEQLGFRKVWLTPHVMEDYPNSRENLMPVFEELRNAWKGNVELALASENMLDTAFESNLRDNTFLPIGDAGDHLLFETSYFTPPMEMEEMVEGIMKAGYFPILAHPERYRYMEKDDYEKWKGLGVKFQANLTSSVGAYGEQAMKKLEWLLEKGMVDLVGTDVHRLDSVLAWIEKSPKKNDVLERIHEIARHPLEI